MKPAPVNKIRFIASVAAFAAVLIFGIVFLILSTVIIRQPIPENYIETEATITRIDEILLSPGSPSDADNNFDDYEYHVYVDYSYNGKDYTECEYGNYSSSMKEGDTVLLYLNPDAPADFISDPTSGKTYVIIGAVIVLIGVCGIASNIYKKKRGVD